MPSSRLRVRSIDSTLRIPFQALRHRAHSGASFALAPPVVVARKPGALALRLLPAFDEATGAQLGIDTDFGFDLHGPNGALRTPLGGLAHEGWITLGHAAGGLRAKRVEHGACSLPCGDLVRQDWELQLTYFGHIRRAPPVATHGLAQVGRRHPLAAHVRARSIRRDRDRPD